MTDIAPLLAAHDAKIDQLAADARSLRDQIADADEITSTTIVALETQVRSVENRLAALQRIVIQNHEHRLNLLDGCDGKLVTVPTQWRMGTTADQSSPQYDPKIDKEFPPIVTMGGPGT